MNIEQWDEHRYIKEAIDEMIQSMDDSSQMKNIVSHVCNSGGKMIRPIILILTTEICGGDPRDSTDAALAIELIHSASLIHDDLLDGGLIRRGIPAAHERFGYSSAMLCGDFLISKSIELISSYDSKSIRDFGRAGMSMSEGETIDIRSSDEEFRVDNYFECIHKKTASLFAASASIGAYIAGADEDTADLCRSYGQYVGTAYQIVDDLLEYLQLLDDKMSTHESVTLPHIYLQNMSNEEAIEKTIGDVERYVSQARNIINKFESSEATGKLLKITNHITIDMLPQEKIH